MNQPKLTVEIISGPLDGHEVTIESMAEWSRLGDGVLSFPWDETLGAPQARFFFAEDRWWLEPLANQRSTRHNGEPINGKIALSEGDWLKAAATWLIVKGITK